MKLKINEAVPQPGADNVLARAETLFKSPREAWTPDRALLPLVEKLRQIRNLLPTSAVFVFTSAKSGEGVTHIVQGLAREIAQHTGERVLVTQPTGLADDADRHGNFDVLERRPSNFPDLQRRLENSEVEVQKNHLATLREEFDYVLVDCPSLRQSADALMLGKVSDGVCLVVAADETTRTEIQGAVTALSLVAVPLIGFVLNKRKYPVPGFLYKSL